MIMNFRELWLRTFNSLFEIPSRIYACMRSRPRYTFNSLFEIRWVRMAEEFSLKIILDFQFSFWDSYDECEKELGAFLDAFQFSFWDSHHERAEARPINRDRFQFSFWDSWLGVERAAVSVSHRQPFQFSFWDSGI